MLDPSEVQLPNIPGLGAGRLNQDCFSITIEVSELGRSCRNSLPSASTPWRQLARISEVALCWLGH